MIYYFVTERHAPSMRQFLERWGGAVAGHLSIVTYDLFLTGRVQVPEQGGTYIFTNLGTLKSMPADAQSAINAFNAYRTDGPVAGLRYPVFIRNERESRSDPPVLAQTPQQYGALLNGIVWMRGTRSGLITVEYCDVASSDGLYRKYGAFIVGD